MASPARDALFEECLQRLLFKISSFMEHVQPHLSVRSRHFQRAKSILDGTIGSAIDAWSLGAKRAVSEWLFLGKIKPGEIHEVERQLHCNLDELPSLMKDANSREELIRKLFMGPNGLATGSDLKELQLFLDNALTRVFDSKHTSRQEEPSGLQLKMERLVRDLIKTTVCVSSPQRQEILLCKLFELAAGKKHYAPEELLARWLPAHSAAMVKALQIVASRPEVRTLLPRLYEASKECKSHAPSMRMIDAMKAVVRNHALRKEDPVIEGQLAAASIKVVYKARFHNTQRVLKVKQVSVEKDLAESQAEIEAVYTTLQPLLTELFDIHSFPRIGRRIARAIASEIDFASERHNGTLLGIGLADKGLAARLGMRVSTPWIDDNLSDDNILVEEFVAGETLSSYLEKHPDDALRLSRSNQRLYLRLLQEGIVLSDLHQGNQMLQGTSSMTLIDTGSLFTLEPAELRMFKDVILGLSSPIAPKYFLKRALESVVGEQYENNRVLIDERLDAITALTGAERPVALLALFDDIPDFYLSETLYWSILGLSKPFGLDTFHLSNLPEYWSVLRG